MYLNWENRISNGNQYQNGALECIKNVLKFTAHDTLKNDLLE